MSFADSSIYPDLKLSFNGRSYPAGMQVVGALGVAYPIWGDHQTWKYGYVRGGLNLMTSAVVNHAGIELQVYPISIAGITFGYDTGIRNYVPSWLDCNFIECTGRLDRKYVRFNLFAAHSHFYFMLMSRYDELHGYGSSKPMFDEVTILVGNRNGEKVFTLNPVVLYKLTDLTSIGVVSLYSHALDTGGYSHLFGPLVNLTPQPKFNALLGVGLNSSPVAHSAITAFFLLQYNIAPSLAITDLAIRDASESPSQ